MHQRVAADAYQKCCGELETCRAQPVCGAVSTTFYALHPLCYSCEAAFAVSALATTCFIAVKHVPQANNFAADGADGDDDVVLMAGEDGGSTAVRVPRQVVHVR